MYPKLSWHQETTQLHPLPARAMLRQLFHTCKVSRSVVGAALLCLSKAAQVLNVMYLHA